LKEQKHIKSRQSLFHDAHQVLYQYQWLKTILSMAAIEMKGATTSCYEGAFDDLPGERFIKS
jgi:hypothetical protein